VKCYYLDTCIWLDFYEQRGENGEYALKLILKLLANDDLVIYSDLHLREFKRLGYSLEEINNLFKILKPGHIRRVHIHPESIAKARTLCLQRRVPWGDALHALLAQRNIALMVSRDNDFEKLRDVCETKKPEEIYRKSFSNSAIASSRALCNRSSVVLRFDAP